MSRFQRAAAGGLADALGVACSSASVSLPLLACVCMGLKGSGEKHSAYSLAVSASALMGAAFGSGMGGVRKCVQ